MSLLELFSAQNEAISEMLNGSFKEKTEEAINGILQRSRNYCEGLFSALDSLIEAAVSHLSDYRDWKEKRDLRDLKSDVEKEKSKCLLRYFPNITLVLE